MFLEEKVIPRIPVVPDDPGRSTLLAAADYMARHGWCQGEPSDSKGRVCLANSINHVTRFDQPGYSAACNLLKRYLGVTSIAMWNDLTCRTKEQALAALIGASG